MVIEVLAFKDNEGVDRYVNSTIEYTKDLDAGNDENSRRGFLCFLFFVFAIFFPFCDSEEAWVVHFLPVIPTPATS